MEKNNQNLKKIIMIAAMALLLVIIISSCITTVPTGYVGIRTRFGAVQSDIINEGMNLKIPFIEKIVKIDCRTQKVETSSESSTKDLQTVQVSIAVNYNVNKDTANLLYQEVGVDYASIIIQPAILESIKSSMAQYTAEELITKRAEVSNKIQETLDNAEETKRMIEEMKVEYDEKLKAARFEGQQITAEYKEMAQKEYNAIVEDAKKNAERIIVETRKELEVEKKQIMDGIKEEISNLVIAASEKLIRENMNTEINQKLVKEFIDNEHIA